MDTLKTGFIVLLLLAVLYGVYVVLNKDQTPPTAEIAWHQQQAEQELQIDVGSPTKDPTKAPAASGKLANEPSLLATPANNPSTTKAVALGSPSVVAAERSPLATDDAVPNSNGGEVAAPSLLAAEVRTSTQGSSSSPDRSGDLTSLPALREPPTSWPPDARPPTVDNNPAIKMPDRTEVANAPIATNQAPLPANGSSPDNGAISAELNTRVPGDTTPDAGTGLVPNLKSVTTAAAFGAAMREAQSNLAAAQWYQALFVLSKFYGSPDLSAQQDHELIDLLDPLAAKVVYSQEHLIADAHEVRRGDTLAQIAAANQVPPELLSNINGIENPDLLVPGTTLKVVRGPFRADIHLQKKELTLFAGQLYAGRFPISVGLDPDPQPGDYRILEKQLGRDYFSATGQKLAAGDPQNPFGRIWIGLDKELAIHGSPERGDVGTMGCISLSPLDAADVYSILAQGSSVTIRR